MLHSKLPGRPESIMLSAHMTCFPLVEIMPIASKPALVIDNHQSLHKTVCFSSPGALKSRAVAGSDSWPKKWTHNGVKHSKETNMDPFSAHEFRTQKNTKNAPLPPKKG